MDEYSSSAFLILISIHCFDSTLLRSSVVVKQEFQELCLELQDAEKLWGEVGRKCFRLDVCVVRWKAGAKPSQTEHLRGTGNFSRCITVFTSHVNDWFQNINCLGNAIVTQKLSKIKIIMIIDILNSRACFVMHKGTRWMLVEETWRAGIPPWSSFLVVVSKYPEAWCESVKHKCFTFEDQDTKIKISWTDRWSSMAAWSSRTFGSQMLSRIPKTSKA